MSTRDLKQTAKTKLKGNWGVAIAVLFVAAIILGALSTALWTPRISRVTSNGNGSGTIDNNYTAAVVAQSTEEGILASGASVILNWLATLCSIAQLFLFGPVMVGVFKVFLDILRGNKAVFRDMFGGFRRFGANMSTGILHNVFIALWSLLFVIPGIVKAYAYAMTFYIQNDHPEMSGTDAITASKTMMKGNKAKLFLLDFSFIGWYLLSALTAGILLFYVIPYHVATRTEFYNQLIHYGEETPSEEKSGPSAQDVIFVDDPFAN